MKFYGVTIQMKPLAELLHGTVFSLGFYKLCSQFFTFATIRKLTVYGTYSDKSNISLNNK